MLEYCCLFPFLTPFEVQLSVNVETTVVSQIDESKSHSDIEAPPADTPTLVGFDEAGCYDVIDIDREDKKYRPLV